MKRNARSIDVWNMGWTRRLAAVSFAVPVVALVGGCGGGEELLDAIGGASNIVSAAHCATRLRLVIADNDKVDKKALENAEGAKGVFEAQGQLQIIFGTGTVNKVYDEFTALAGIGAATKEEVKQAAAAKAPWYQQAIKTLGDIFVPIIPAIAGSRMRN